MALTTKKAHKGTALLPTSCLSLWYSHVEALPNSTCSLRPLTTQSQQTTRKRRLEGQRSNQGSECLSPLPWPHSGLIQVPGGGPGSLHVLPPQSRRLFLPSRVWLTFSSVAQSCPTLCDPMNCSTPGLPVHHQLPEFTQTLVHRVRDAIQPSHPRSSPSPPAPNPSQHQGLFP